MSTEVKRLIKRIVGSASVGLLREPGKLLKGRGVDDLWRYWLCYQLFNSSSAPRVMAAERQREGERI